MNVKKEHGRPAREPADSTNAKRENNMPTPMGLKNYTGWTPVLLFGGHSCRSKA
jgi:hypothetical protein